MVKNVKRFFLYLDIAGLVQVSNPLFAQLRLGDMGSHKVTKDLDLQLHNINTATPSITANRGVYALLASDIIQLVIFIN